MWISVFHKMAKRLVDINVRQATVLMQSGHDAWRIRPTAREDDPTIIQSRQCSMPLELMERVGECNVELEFDDLAMLAIERTLGGFPFCQISSRLLYLTYLT